MANKTLLTYIFLTFTIFINNHPLLSQKYTLSGFSNIYYAKVKLINPEKNEATISIYDKTTNKKILTVNSDSYVLETKLRNSNKLDHQDIVLWEDFNFDNHEDFAIQTGYSSKGPSYTIFIFKNGNYIYNKIYTEIIQNSQGDFDLEKESKTISTRGNGGCCWHSYSTFVVFNGLPKLMKKTVLEADFSIETETTTAWKNGKYVTNTVRTIDLKKEGIKEIMSFKLKDKKKKLVLYNINDRTLNYALIDPNNIVEFYFPIEVEYKKPDFGINSSSNELIFLNKDVKYKIYQKKENGKM